MTTRLILAAAALLAAPAHATDYPLTIENCDQSLVFDAAPARVVTIGQSTTEMLCARRLADRMQGTSVWFNEILPEFAETNAGIERLADNHPGFEAVMGKQPELVTTQFEFHLGAKGVVGTREQFNEIGTQVYAMPADCVDKDNMVGGDGERMQEFSITLMYQALRELAQIFDVEERSNALEAEMRDRVDTAANLARDLGAEGKTAVVWFSSPDIALDPFVAGQNGIAGFVLKTLGLHNVIDSAEEWPSIGWETIASADPDYIIIARMDRRRFAADDHEVKLDYLQTDPVTRHMSAVRDGRSGACPGMTDLAAGPAQRRSLGLPWLGAGLAALRPALALGISIGETFIPPQVIWRTLANRLAEAGHDLHPIQDGIIWNYRLTRALVAAACGAGLAVSGVVLQALLRNALADPYILGISAGASTGAVLVMVLGIGAGAVSLSVGAFAGGCWPFRWSWHWPARRAAAPDCHKRG